MKILLIKPPMNKISILGNSLVEPLELEILAATIPEHECRILDMRIDRNLERTLLSFQPNLVGITAYTTDVPIVNVLFRKVKQFLPDSFTVVGGCHASVMPADFFTPYIDAVVVGNGEHAFPELVQHLAGKRSLAEVASLWLRNNDKKFVFTGEGMALNHLDDFPRPRRDLTEPYRRHYYFGSNRPAAALVTSRGCPFRCSFCSIWRIMRGKYLTRQPSKVVSELVEIREKHVFVADDNTLSHAQHAENLYRSIADSGIQKNYKMYGRADAIVKRPDLVEKWRRIGLRTVIMGLESFQDERLSALNKKSTVQLQDQAVRILKANGIRVRAYFIVDPAFTREDFKRLMESIREREITEPMFTVLTPLPGTKFYEEAHHDLILDDYEFFDLLHAVLPTRLPRSDFYFEMSRLYRGSYSLRQVAKEMPFALRTGRLYWSVYSYLMFRSRMFKLKHAHKAEPPLPSPRMSSAPGIWA